MTITVKNKIELVVPPSVRRRGGIKAGDRLDFRVSGRVITIVPKPAESDEYTPRQRRIIDARLAKSDEDIKAGRTYGPFNTVEEMAASIEANINNFRAAKKPKPAR